MKKRQDQDQSKAPRANPDALSPEALQRLVHELDVHQIELKTQNEELRRATELLRESEAKFRDLFDNAEVAMFRTRLDGSEILDVNRKWLELLGLTREQAVGKPSSIRWVDPQEREKMVRMLVADGSVSDFEFQMLNPQQGVRDGVTSLRLYPEQGILVGSIRDISDRKRAEAALRESKERFELILHSAAEGIYGLDPEGKCTFCNAAALRMLGYREEQELLGRNIHDLVHHTRADGTPNPREKCPALRTCTTGDPAYGDGEILWRSDGVSFPVEFWAHRMRLDGNVVGAVVTFVDRTEHRALENQLRQSQKLEAVGQLAAGLAHDFNNILSAIIGHGHLALLKSAADDPLRLNVESMMQASYQASRLVQSLLALGRQQLVRFKPADLNAVVDGALKLEARTLGPGIELKTALAEQPLPVRVDPGQIEMLLQNLAANAVAAMPGGGALTVATGRIEINAQFVAARGFGRPGPAALLTVSDTGAGMDEETQKRVFEPFFTTQEFGQGSGLGLAVAYGIVKQHDGFITVSSQPGAGTTFSVYLPLFNVAG